MSDPEPEQSSVLPPVAGAEDTLAQRAYRLVRERVLKGIYPPGAALSRRRLADEFGMSLLPVAEALQRLVNDGLLESRPRVGTRVRMLRRDEIRDRYTLREALESQSARLFAQRAKARDKAEILRLAQKLDGLYADWESHDADADYRFSVRQFHVNFHLRIAEIAGSPLLRFAIEREQDLLFSWLSDTAAQIHPLPPHYHSELAESLCSGELNRADEAIRHHIRYALEELLKFAEEPNGSRWRMAPRRAE
ncbi:MAG: GntR family transcriptional regulator [Acidobacteria bacterium]|nr:GntR family transcriptional regulator [Acidobacteriota bacterium]